MKFIKVKPWRSGLDGEMVRVEVDLMQSEFLELNIALKELRNGGPSTNKANGGEDAQICPKCGDYDIMCWLLRNKYRCLNCFHEWLGKLHHS